MDNTQITKLHTREKNENRIYHQLMAHIVILHKL